MSYLLTPPTRPEPVSADARDHLWSRVVVQRGRCLRLHTDGRVTVVDVVDPDDATVLRYWPGGRTFIVSDADAATLTAAGYGANLTPIA